LYSGGPGWFMHLVGKHINAVLNQTGAGEAGLSMVLSVFWGQALFVLACISLYLTLMM